MKNQYVSLAVSLLCIATATTQSKQPTSLLFTPNKTEQTRSGSNGTVLRILTERAIGVVTPGGTACRYSAEKFAPLMAWQTLFGDENNNGRVYREGLLGAVKAILVKPYRWDPRAEKAIARTKPVNHRQLYITPAERVGTNVSGTPGLRQCDSGAVIANGQIRYFIRGEQLIAALGMVDKNGKKLLPKNVCLDAITVDRSRRIFVSFEEDHTLTLRNCSGGLSAYTLHDGGIAVIPPSSWIPNALGNVGTITIHSARIALSESQIDAMVANAQAADAAGTCLTTAKDLDGLAMDHRGGTFQAKWCKKTVSLPNLLFCTLSGTGASVLTTANGGQIANMNGCALATGCAGTTDGAQMGLKATGGVGSLDGLATLFRDPCRFVIGTPDATCLGGMCEWHIGTNMNVPGTFLHLGPGALPISPAVNITATLGLPTDCFPEYFPNAFTYGPFLVAMAPDGWGGRTGVFGPVFVPGGFPGGLIAQALAFSGGHWQASTPATIVE